MADENALQRKIHVNSILNEYNSYEDEFLTFEYDFEESYNSASDSSEYDFKEGNNLGSEEKIRYEQYMEAELNRLEKQYAQIKGNSQISILTKESCDLVKWKETKTGIPASECTKQHIIKSYKCDIHECDFPYNWFEDINGNFIWQKYADEIRRLVVEHRRLVIHGPEGCGKTTCIGEYMRACLKMKNIYPNGLFWVNACTSISLLRNMAKLAFQIGIFSTEPQNLRGILEDVLQWLRYHEGWIITFYCVSSEAVAKEICNGKFNIPTNGHIIISTCLDKDKLDAIVPSEQCLRIEQLPHIEIRKLIMHNCDTLTPEQIRFYDKMVCDENGTPLTGANNSAIVENSFENGNPSSNSENNQSYIPNSEEFAALCYLAQLCKGVPMNATLLSDLFKKQLIEHRNFRSLHSLILPTVSQRELNTNVVQNSQNIFNCVYMKIKQESPISDLILSIAAFCHASEIPLILFVEGIAVLPSNDLRIGQHFKYAMKQLLQILNDLNGDPNKLIEKLESAKGTVVKLLNRGGNIALQMPNAIQCKYRETNTTHRRELLIMLAKMCINVSEKFAGNVAIRKQILRHAESCLMHFDKDFHIKNDLENNECFTVYVKLKIEIAATYFILFHLDLAYEISENLQSLLDRTEIDLVERTSYMARIFNIQGLVLAWKGAESEGVKRLEQALRKRKTLSQTANEQRLTADLHKWVAFCYIELENREMAQRHLDKADHIIEGVLQESPADVDPRVWRSRAHILCQRGKLHKLCAYQSAYLNCNAQTSLQSKLEFKEHIRKALLLFKAADYVNTRAGAEYRCLMYKVLVCEMEGLLILETEGPRSSRFKDKVDSMRQYLKDIIEELGLYHRFPVRVKSKLVCMLISLGDTESLHEAMELTTGAIQLQMAICKSSTNTKIGEFLLHKGKIHLSLNQPTLAIETIKKAKRIFKARDKRVLLSQVAEFERVAVWKSARVDELSRNQVLAYYQQNTGPVHRAGIQVGSRRRHLSEVQY